MLYVPYLTVHRHTTIVTNETFVNASVGPRKPSIDRGKNANGDRVSDFSALDHFRHKMHRVGSMLWVYIMVCLRVWLHIKPYWTSKTLLLHNLVVKYKRLDDVIFPLFWSIFSCFVLSSSFMSGVFMQVGCLCVLHLCIIQTLWYNGQTAWYRLYSREVG